MRLEQVSKAGGGGRVFPDSVEFATDQGDGPHVTPADGEMAATIVEMAPAGIVIVDPGGTITFANAAAATMFGYSRPGLTGLPVEVVVPGFPAYVRGLPGHGAGAPAGSRVRDLPGRRADGSELLVGISVSSARLGGRPATIVVLHQVDDERELFRRLILEEDERIASDLNDRIVKRLFLAGMKIQSVLQLTDHPVTQRLSETVDQLDAIIREIRRTVFAASRPDTIDGDNPLGA